MKLEYLSLCNFRNIECQTIEFSDGVNILYGNNAQGKTNAIEAAYMFACAKSFRAVRNRELIRHGCDTAQMACEFSGQAFRGSERLKIDIGKNGAKHIYKNAVKLDRLSEFLGQFRVVLFCPEHLSLIKDGPGERRSFIDAAICQLKPRYASILHEYMVVSAHRSALLRQLASGRRDEGMLEIWDEKLSQCAGEVIPVRRQYIEMLAVRASEQYSRISGGRERLTVKYRCDVPPDIVQKPQIAEYYRKMLASCLQNDIKYGFTTKGIMRDDLQIEVNSHSARSYCSQGQQRSCVLSLKLAEGDISENETGEYPVLLFDDILSELDSSRQSFVLSELEGKQVIVTDCSRSGFKGLDAARIIMVKGGVYSQKK
ncbi:MAG: DNA replication/repair protein RecF [Firmicutes bacterium]|nr:DNA replication/repair protein RecF [Bacillota bacterium]